jgi:hypothetical protein
VAGLQIGHRDAQQLATAEDRREDIVLADNVIEINNTGKQRRKKGKNIKIKHGRNEK